MWAEKFIPGSRFFSLSRGYAGARAEKFISGSIFLCLSLAYTGARAEKLPADSIFLSPSRAYTVARTEKLPTDSRFLCLSREVCWCVGREIFYRQHISQSKPGDMLVRGQKNFLQTADFSA